MPENIRSLPDSELEIMKTIWDAGGRVTSAQVLARLKNRRTWKTTSVLTFLSRLAEKGFLSVERQGKVNIYTALVDEKQYQESEGRSFLEKLYGNSLTSFIASLYDSNAISEDDLKELRDLIDEKTQEG